MNGIECAFVAYVGGQPELRTSQGGKPWAAFNACVGKDEETQWLRVAVFGDRAQQLTSQLRKGDHIYVEGRLKMETWTGKDNAQRSGLKVAAWKVERMGEIGRNKPAKPQPLPEGDNPVAPVIGAAHQAPTDRQRSYHRIDDEIAF